MKISAIYVNIIKLLSTGSTKFRVVKVEKLITEGNSVPPITFSKIIPIAFVFMLLSYLNRYYKMPNSLYIRRNSNSAGGSG